LIAYSKAYLKDIDTIEDAIHDLFVYLWNKKERLSDVDKIKPYLLVSLRHILLKILKNQKTKEPLEEQSGFLQKEVSVEEKWIGEEFDAEVKGFLKEGFENLSGRQKQAIYLRYYESMEYEEICTVMEINYQSVRNLISKGIKALGEQLKNKM